MPNKRRTSLKFKHTRPKNANQSEIMLVKEKLVELPKLLMNDSDAIKRLEQRFADYKVPLSDDFYSPINTFKIFLSQVCSADQSCQNAVAQAIAESYAIKGKTVSPDTGNYCRARQQLPEELIHNLMRETGVLEHQKSDATWLWHNRPVKIIDGTTVSMPDTEANQKEYPQPSSQKEGLGFPQARLCALMSLSTGSVLDASVSATKGKGSGEMSLFRQILRSLKRGDVLLGDRYYASFFLMKFLKDHGVDCLFRLPKSSRHKDLKKNADGMIKWNNPGKPEFMSEKEFTKYPKCYYFREVKVGKLLLITTLNDEKFTPKSLSNLYKRRYEIELNLRSIKTIMQMDILRCKTPAMVRKEIWMHLLAYNLIRGLISDAGRRYNKSPQRISFMASLQIFMSFKASLYLYPKWDEAYEILLSLIAGKLVVFRPKRLEPRAIKRRPRTSNLLMFPRDVARMKAKQALRRAA